MRYLLGFLLLLGPALAGAEPYTNSRYGFAVDIPAGFRPLPEAENGDGRIFQSADGKASLRVYGSNNVSNDTAESIYASRIRACPGKIAYKTRGRNWFVLSWSEGSSITYEKSLVGAGSSNTLLIVYPKSQIKRFHPLVTGLEASFKPGDLSRSH